MFSCLALDRTTPVQRATSVKGQLSSHSSFFRKRAFSKSSAPTDASAVGEGEAPLRAGKLKKMMSEFVGLAQVSTKNHSMS